MSIELGPRRSRADPPQVEVHLAQVSMAQARHPETEQLFAAADIPTKREDWPKPLRCRFCEALVHTVLTQPTERRRARAPHFARYPSKDGGSNLHRRGCPYDLDTLITVLVDESGGELEHAGSVTTEDGHRAALYRLPLPEAFGPRAPAGDSGAGPVTVGEQSLPLLNTAAKITVLLEYYEQLGAQVDVEFRAVCRGAEVEWLNFFYTPRRTWVLEQRARMLGDPPHPVAVVLRPTSRHKPGRPRGWVRATAGTPAGHDPTTVVLFVDGPAYLVDEAFAPDGVLDRQWYVGFGMWRRVSYQPGQPERLTLTLDRTSAIAPLPPTVHRQVLTAWQNRPQ